MVCFHLHIYHLLTQWWAITNAHFSVLCIHGFGPLPLLNDVVIYLSIINNSFPFHISFSLLIHSCITSHGNLHMSIRQFRLLFPCRAHKYIFAGFFGVLQYNLGRQSSREPRIYGQEDSTTSWIEIEDIIFKQCSASLHKCFLGSKVKQVALVQ